MKFRITKLIIIVWVVMLFWLMWVEIKKPKRAVIFCNVGQGDMAMVIDGEFQMIVDTGPTGRAGVECLERNLPIWDRKIEVVIITHEDADHSGGLLDIQKSYSVEKVNLGEGDMVRYGGVGFRVVEMSDNGLVGELTDGGNYFLMMADVSAEVEQGLVWRGRLGARNEELGTRQGTGGARVLKVSHHGSRDGTTEELLEAVKPMEAVISVGVNKYGHPAPETIKRLEEFGVKIRRTDVENDVIYEIR